MSVNPKRVESEFDADGSDIDSKLAELLGTTVDLESEMTADESSDLPASTAQGDVEREQPSEETGKPQAAEGSDLDSQTDAPVADAKQSRRDRSTARLERCVDDALRLVVDNYEFAAEAPLASSIAVVAALPGEGVTTMANGLARVLAQDFDTAVCVVDTHTDRPGPGLYEVLTGEAVLDEVLVDDGDGIVRLSLGQVPASARNSWFRLPEWPELIKTLTNEFGHCIFDTPPMLRRSHTLTLLRHVGAHVLVTRYGSTSASQVKTIADQLRNHPRLGSVLNAYRTKTPHFIRRFFPE